MMLHSGLSTNRSSEIEVREHAPGLSGGLMPQRSLVREERYDPISGVTITVWSNAAGPVTVTEQRPN